MPMIVTPESALGQELAKWNKPYVFQPYPKMLYRAERRPDGVVSVVEHNDSLFGGNPGAAEQFSKRCQFIVKNEREEAEYLERGWRSTQAEALALFEAREMSRARSAAHRAYEDRNLSEAARAEMKEAEDATPEHVAEVPEKPRMRRARRA